MPEIGFDEAKKFLDEITSEDKVAIVHHDDLDGFASGILFYDWCKKKGAEVQNFVFKLGDTSLLNLGLEDFSKIIISDVAPYFVFDDLKSFEDKRVFYTDHHPSEFKIAGSTLEYRTTSEGYIPSSRTAYELTEIKSWLSLAGVLADAGDLYPENAEFIEENLQKVGMTLEDFKKKVMFEISNAMVYFDKNLQKAFEIILEIDSIDGVKVLEEYSRPVEEEINFWRKKIDENSEKIGNVNLVIVEPKFPIRGILITNLSMSRPDEIFVFLSTKNSDPDFYGISSRFQSDDADLPSLLRAGTKGLEGSNAGGHKRAAGGQIMKKDLEKFKDNLRNFVEGQNL